MLIIYVLQLENNKYYIGKTHNLKKRYEEHKSGSGSIWTSKYKPLKVENIIINASPYDEDKYTIEYMYKYGIDNVRGGIYVSEKLNDNQIKTINKLIYSANNCCYNCGQKGHFIKWCPYNKKHINPNINPNINQIINPDIDLYNNSFISDMNKYIDEFTNMIKNINYII